LLSSLTLAIRPRTAAAVLTIVALLAGLIAAVAWKPEVASAAGSPTRIITYEVRGLDNVSDLEQFAAQAAATYADSRGWSMGGSVAFVRVPSGGSFTLYLAAASHLPGFGSPCSTAWSCTQGRSVIINETRWLNGSPAWTASRASLADYRHMVLNHETGHWLGFGHSFCSGAGRPAPVMQQQSISLQGCAPNPWPLDGERRSAAARLGVEIRVGVPIGHLDTVRPWWHGARVTGWAIDPDTAAPDLVRITVDGAATAAAAALPRTDIAAAFPGYGAGHGFDVVVPAAPGSHVICAAALNVAGAGVNVLLGCQTVVVGSPFGLVEGVQAGPGVLRVTGWALDPTTAASIPVHVYVDNAATVATANLARADVGARFSGAGANHGFDRLITTAPGAHRVCVYGIDTAPPGGNALLGCRTVTVGGSPIGALDSVRAGPGVIQVAGWVIDRDLATAGRVHVYIDDAATAIDATGPRADLERAYPLYGPNHGYNQVLSTTPGAHRVCVYGVNIAGPGGNTTLGCRAVTIGGSPFGAVDGVTAASGAVRVRGWVIDRDTAAPATVHVYIDGVGAAVPAGGSRPDVEAAYPLYGIGHGYDTTIATGAGAHRVCVYGINGVGPGANTTLACRTVTVPA
jgi:hypothetical protein